MEKKGRLQLYIHLLTFGRISNQIVTINEESMLMFLSAPLKNCTKHQLDSSILTLLWMEGVCFTCMRVLMVSCHVFVAGDTVILVTAVVNVSAPFLKALVVVGCITLIGLT